MRDVTLSVAVAERLAVLLAVAEGLWRAVCVLRDTLHVGVAEGEREAVPICDVVDVALAVRVDTVPVAPEIDAHLFVRLYPSLRANQFRKN